MLKQINNVLIFCVVFLALISLNGCKDRPPVVERCIIGEEDNIPTCLCYNPDTDRDVRSEDIGYCTNFIATSPDNYRIVETWVQDKLKELEQCQSQE